ncbi:MAG TPA: membrane protein insertase YidC [bacterium]|nr:membrane protein insertase YidC [bacterium]
MPEEKDRGMTIRLVLAVVISIVAMVGINFIIGLGSDEEGKTENTTEKPGETEKPVETLQPAAEEETVAVETAPAESVETPAPATAEPRLTPDQERLITLETDLIILRFSNIGGALKSVTLKEHKDYDGSQLVLFNKALGEYYPGMVSTSEFDALTVHTANHAAGEYKIEGEEQFTVTYSATVAGIRVVKNYTFRGDSYLGHFDLTVDYPTQDHRSFNLNLGTGLDRQGDMRELVRSLLVTTGEVGGEEFEESPGDNDLEEASGPIAYMAIADQYFALALKPTEALTGGRVALEPLLDPPKIANTVIEVRTDASGRFKDRFQLYIGPKQYDTLQALGMGDVADFGWDFLAPIAIGALKLLNFFEGFLGNYGLAILLLSIALKLVMVPLTNKSFRSTIAMQRLQPKIEAIKEKYANDQQRANQEIMELYKKHKVSPLGGCLPLLLQMPIFIALFGALRSAVELRGAGFLWIADLTLPDSLFNLGFTIPLLGWSTFNLLPILMTAAMWYQGKMTTSSGVKQKGFTKYLPLIFGVLFYNMPSGLVVYWITNTVLTMAQQYWLRKVDEAKGVSEPEPRGKVVKTVPASEPKAKPKPKPKKTEAAYEVQCEKCGHKTDWKKTLRREYKKVNLRSGGKGDVDGVYCPRCGAALALAVDDDPDYSLVAADPERPIPPKEDRDWGKFLPKPKPGEEGYNKVKTK